MKLVFGCLVKYKYTKRTHMHIAQKMFKYKIRKFLLKSKSAYTQMKLANNKDETFNSYCSIQFSFYGIYINVFNSVLG